MLHPEQKRSHCSRQIFHVAAALVFVLCVVTGVTGRAANISILSIKETYGTLIRNDPDFGPTTVPTVSSTLTAIYTNVISPDFTKKSQWSVALAGGFLTYSGYFSNDVNFASGNHSARLPFVNDDTRQASGTVFVSWDNGTLQVRVTTSEDLMNALSYYTGATAPIIDTSDIVISIGKFTNTATLFVSGRNSYRLDGPTQLDIDSGSVLARADYVPPAVTIQSPGANFATLNPVLNVSGTASDNIGVSAVLWRWAAPGDDPTLPAAHYTDWNTVDTLNLPESGAPTPRAVWRTEVDMSFNVYGTNRLWVVSQDLTERYSAIQTRNFFYSVPSPLSLQATEGGRAIGGSGVFDGANLIIDRMYSVNAMTTDTNSIFLNWTDGEGNVVSITPLYKFRMQDSLSLQANFGPNPFPNVQGNYLTLFSPSNGINEVDSGVICLKVTPRGTYTGTIALEAGTYPFSGQFGFYNNSSDPNGADSSFQAPIRNGANILGTLHFPGTNSESGGLKRTITGQLSIYDFRQARRVLTPLAAVYSPTNSGSVAPGTYNFQLPTANGTTQVGPLGYGYGTILVRSNATALVSVNLADQTPVVVCNTMLTENGKLPLLVTPYARKGAVIGWLTFTNEATSDLRGDNVHWYKRRNLSTFYKEGFHRVFEPGNMITGCRYVPPKAGTNVLTWTDGTINCGDFAFSGTTPIWFDTAVNRFSFPNGNPDYIRVTLASTTGVFGGTMSRPALPMRGIILPKAKTAYGFFLDQNQSGFVVLTKP